MKAAVCYEYSKPLVIEDVTLDPPKQGEVKVKISATAICHSDIHAIKGDFPAKVPFVAGHESAGYVEEVGQGVTSVRPGDPVVVSLLSSCGKCRYCLTGRSHMCNAAWPLDTETRMHNRKGQDLAQGTKTGSFAEYTIVDQSQLVKIPADMPMDCASLLGCGVIAGFGAVVNRARVEPMSSCVIIGAGGVGLNAVQGAAISGAYPIIAVDILDKKLEASKTFGATHTVNSNQKDAFKEIIDLTGGGANYIFITVGSMAAINLGLSLSGPRGMVVFVGIPGFTQTLPFNPSTLIHDEKVLTGSFMGSTKIHTGIPKLVELYKAKKLKLDEVITGRYSLSEINRAIELVEKGEALRNVIMFE